MVSLPSQVKSFIETQKALLAEIQNGCKRNFILAKEKEEKEQKLQQSASMPEITVTEPLEDPAEDSRDGSATSAPEEGEEARETPMASENGDTEPAEDGDDRNNMTDSDSDTDEETDAGLETKDLSEMLLKSPDSTDGASAPQPLLTLEKPRDRPPPLPIAEESQRDAGVGSPAVSPASTPSQGNERRISVSSPGRGHKIFVVTRVESLPERATSAAHSREDTAAVAKSVESQNPALAIKPELPASWANGTIPEAAASLATPSIGSDPKRGDPAVCESSAHDTPLPNGLKTDFARALPEASADGDGKMGSCAAEHGKSSTTRTSPQSWEPPSGCALPKSSVVEPGICAEPFPVPASSWDLNPLPLS